MALELCVLASGSAGNAALLRSPAGVMLIDLGIGPRVLEKRLDGTGVASEEISAVCLTHLDSDHFNANWINTLVRRRMRVYCHVDRAAELKRRATPGQRAEFEPLVRPFDDSAFSPLGGLTARPLAFAHDQAGSHGFVIEGFGSRIGYATDLGAVPPRLYRAFADVDLLAIESNYDPGMQEASDRPIHLKRRIMGGRGHLSNAQALAAIRRISAAGRRPPDHIVLLHRSRDCNCPKLLRSMYAGDPKLAERLTLAEQHERSAWLGPRARTPAAGEQLSLSF